MDCSPPGFSVHGFLQARILEWVAKPSSRGSSQPRDQTQVSRITDRFEPPGKPKNTRVSSLSLLERILLTQELNRGLLHCRWIVYQLSYQGSSSLQRDVKKKKPGNIKHDLLEYLLKSSSNSLV